MAVLALGISHRRAPIELLERLAFDDDRYAKGYRRASDLEAVHEAVILSTCNRVEVYASVPSYHAGFLALKQLLCETCGVGPDELAEPLYAHYEDDAAEHLFRVAAGLDSMVVGEPQILQQVRDAHRRAEREGTTGPAITGLFHSAARTGRRVRTETALGESPVGFVEAGIAAAADALGGLEGKVALVVGAGQMASLAAKHLRSHGLASVTVLGRRAERARALAERTGAEHGDIAALPRALGPSDLVVSATGATGTVISANVVRQALSGRDPARPLFLVDLAVPRDVDPAVAAIPGVGLVDIAGLKDAILESSSGLAGEIAQAERILEDELRRFAVRRRADRLAPLITALRERGYEVMEAELRRHRSRLADLTPDEREVVESLARGIVSKLLHEPIVRLKERTHDDEALARMLSELFDIE